MTSAPTNPVEVPPYHLQPLIQRIDVLEDSGQGFMGIGRSSRATTPKTHVTCAQALGRDIFIGCSDGSLLRYTLPDDVFASEGYLFVARQATPGNKPVDSIAIAPSASKVLVLSDNQIFLFTFPALDQVPVSFIKPIRNVVTFAIDETYAPRAEGDPRPPRDISLCVVKRSSISLFTIGDRLIFLKDVQLPGGAVLARRTGNCLCSADFENYNVIDLKDAHFLPVLPVSQDPSVQVKPMITVIKHNEFLVLSWTGASTLGLFVTSSGDPVRGTLEWPNHPLSVCADYPYIASLMPNRTIEIHSIETQSIVQVVPLQSSSFEPSFVSFSQSGYLVPSTQRFDKLQLVPFQLGTLGDTPDSSSGPVPRTSEAKRSNSSQSDVSGVTTFIRSRVLLVGTNAVQCLLPSTLISQAESLLESRRVEDVVKLAEQARKKVAMTGAVAEQEQAEEIRYIYQRIGYYCLSQTQFEDAGDQLFRGDVDPRILIRLFPGYSGSLLQSATEVEVYAGVLQQIQSLQTIEDIVRNYSPYLKPNTQNAPSTAELKNILMANAREMLVKYLRKFRNRRMYSQTSGGIFDSEDVNTAVDTVLAKLLAESEQTSELSSLIDESSYIVSSEVEQVLIKAGQYSALAKLYQKEKNEPKLLEIWTKMVDGEWTDPEMLDPLARIVALLTESRDRPLVQRYGLWLVKRDPDAGLKILTSRETRKGANDALMLRQIREANPVAGTQYLEHLVLQKRSLDPIMHTELALCYVERLFELMQDSDVVDSFEFAVHAYMSENPIATPFLTHFATTAPDSEHKVARLKAVLFLQGSTYYDAEAVASRLRDDEDNVLAIEKAIVDGRLGNHREALTSLVHTLEDSTTAEAYCVLGGEVVSPKVAQSIAEQSNLQPWAALLVGNGTRGTPGGMRKKLPLEESKKRELLKLLLEVYMSQGEEKTDHTARLLNSQAVNLEVTDVLSLVPSNWSLSIVSSFLSRSFRRSLHERHESMILKAVSLGQNLETSEAAWAEFRAQGAIVEEPLPSEENDDGTNAGEKVLSEKADFENPSPTHHVVDLHLDEKERFVTSSDWDERDIES